MVRVRKLVLAIAAASALTSGMAHALGLGEVTLKSALNQPLDAEIELLEVRDLGSSEVVPSLATPEEFNKAGVDRQFFLNDLKFTPVLKPNGKSVIRVTSSKPVREPYLNFLVQVLWPNGRLLREYTLLLDPPLYSPQTTAAAAPQLPVAAPSPRASAPVSRPATPAAPRSPAPGASGASTGMAGANEYRTTASDTLWVIAERTRAGGTVHQSMLAIQDLNPDAFVDGNINRLKNGQVLRLPTEQQIKSRSQAEALAQVAAQNTAWREGRATAAASGTRQLDATKRNAAGAAPASVESKDNLRLVSPESGKSTAGSDKGGNGDSKALRDKLAVTQESLDSTRRENDELKSRMGDLQSQLDKLQKLIQLKDDQLAKLQANLAGQGQAQAPAQPGAVAPAVPATPAQPPAATTQPSAPADSAPQPVPAQPAPTTESPATPTAPQTPAEGTPDYNYQAEPPVAPTPAPEAAAPATPAPTDTAPVPPAEESSFLDDLFGNPLLLGLLGGGALLILLVGLMIMSRRNAVKETELQAALAERDDDTHLDDTPLMDSSFDELNEAPATASVVQPIGEQAVPSVTDVLGEADIYIAYGRFSQAAELLLGAIEAEPHRADLRLKLMEVYAELGDREGFARQENELREIGGSQAEIEQLKLRYPAMAVAGVAAGALAQDDLDSFDLDDLTLDTPDTKRPADDAFDLGDLEADLGRGQKPSDDEFLLDESLDLGAPSARHEPIGEDIDFGLDLAEQYTGGNAREPGDDLSDFSLDLDSSDKSASSDDAFLLDLDEPAKPAPAADDAAYELPADFDLSMPDEHETSAVDSFAHHLEDASASLDRAAEDLRAAHEDASVEPSPTDAPDTAPASLEGDDDFDFLSGTDESATKLDLARAYIDMGDTEGARDILDEVVTEGSDAQRQEARELIAKLG